MTNAPARRVVLDTQVVLDLLHFADPRTRGLRDAIDAGLAHLVCDEPCREEWLRVLEYPVLRLAPAARVELQARYDALVVERIPVAARRAADPPLPRCRDRDDQKFLELAHAARADVLLTRDAALLRLAPRCARQGGFRVLAPERFAQGS
jgi:putative PIN family toxin of toxin-antitoxin system